MLSSLEGHEGTLASRADGVARLSQLRMHAAIAWRAFGRPLASRGHSEASLFRLLVRLQSNGFAISRLLTTAPTRVEGGAAGGSARSTLTTEPQRQRRIAEALFLRASRCNHACVANTNLCFDGRFLELRARRDLAAGEQVFTCYGPEAPLMPYAQRQAALRTQYFFSCRCETCMREGAIEGGALAGDALAGGAQEGARERRERLQPSEEARLLAEVGGRAVGAGPGSVRSSMHSSVHSLLSRAQLSDGLAFEACERDDFTAASRHTAAALECLRQVFPAGSSPLAYEESKLARLLFNGGASEAPQALRDAAEAMRRCVGA